MMAVRIGLVSLALFTGIPLAAGQDVPREDPPRQGGPALSRKEADLRESLHQYVLGVLCERDDRLLEALKAFETSAALDPDSAAPVRAQIPILLALERGGDVIAMCRKVLDLDPADHETWFVYARIQRTLGDLKEARRALERGLASAGLKDRPEMAHQMHFDLALLLENAEEYARAIEELTQAAQILDHPEALAEHGVSNRELIHLRAAEVHERIGHLQRKLRRYTEAVEAYKMAQKHHPNGAGRLNLNLAQVSQELGKLDQAVAFLDAYLRLLPQGLEAYELKLSLLQKLGRTATIVPWLEQAARADAFNIGLQLLLAKQYARFRQFNHAEEIYRELAGKDPTADVYRGLFQLYRDDPAKGTPATLKLLNQTLTKANVKQAGAGAEAAMPHARAMIAALRDDPDLAKDLLVVAFKQIEQNDKLTFETLHFLAVLADRHRHVDEAERFYRKCLPLVTPNTEAIVYSGLLRMLWKARKYREVEQLCRDGLAKAQATKPLLFHSDLALALARLDRLDEALKEAAQAIDLAGDPDRFYLRKLRVRILSMAERYDQAETECLALLKESTLPGETLEVRYTLSSVYSAAKKLAKAEEQLQLILKMDPSNATANNDLGYIWADQGKNLAEAEDMIRKAIDLDRKNRKTSINLNSDEDHDNAAYIDSLGWVLFRRGKIEEARQALERAAKLPDSEDPVIWDHLGDVYFRLGMHGQARAAWRKAIEYFDKEHRRKTDDRYQDLQRKLKLTVGQER